MKIEGLNPAGSIKFKTARALISDMETELSPDEVPHIIESSSGNLGIALAMLCAERGYAFTCVVDPNTAASSIAQIKAYGGNVVIIDKKDENGGFLSSRIAYIKERLKASNSLVWLNQYANPANPTVHETETAPAILSLYPNIDYLFVGAGTTGTLMGCARHFRAVDHPAKIIAVDVEGSVTFGLAPQMRRIPGLGTSRKPEICDETIVDEVIHVSEGETITECRRLARTSGLLVGGSTGSVLAGIRKYSPQIRPGACVVTLSPDLGEKYLDTIYCDQWVGTHYPGSLAASN